MVSGTKFIKKKNLNYHSAADTYVRVRQPVFWVDLLFVYHVWYCHLSILRRAKHVRGVLIGSSLKK